MRMNYMIRIAQINDYQSILSLSTKELGYTFEEDGAKCQLEKILCRLDHQIWVATIEEEVVGYIHAQDCDVVYAPPMVNILGLAVFKQYQGLGIGKALLKEAEEWGKKRNVAEIRLTSAMKRKEAHSFYRHCGYEEIKEQKKFGKMLSDRPMMKQ